MSLASPYVSVQENVRVHRPPFARSLRYLVETRFNGKRRAMSHIPSRWTKPNFSFSSRQKFFRIMFWNSGEEQRRDETGRGKQLRSTQQTLNYEWRACNTAPHYGFQTWKTRYSMAWSGNVVVGACYLSALYEAILNKNSTKKTCPFWRRISLLATTYTPSHCLN